MNDIEQNENLNDKQHLATNPVELTHQLKASKPPFSTQQALKAYLEYLPSVLIAGASGSISEYA